jgi:hypothetical protein
MTRYPVYFPLSLRLLSADPIPSQTAFAHGVSATKNADADILFDSGWEIRALEEQAFAATVRWPSASLRGVVLTDLIAAEVIPDPYIRDHEAKLQAQAVRAAILSDLDKSIRVTLTTRVIGFDGIIHDQMDAQLSDNSFDLLAGIPVESEAKGSGTRAEVEHRLKVTSLRNAFDGGKFQDSNKSKAARGDFN